MSTYTYHEILNQVEQLMPDEQRQLLKDIEAILRRQTEPRHRHSIMELKGLGKEIWEDIDVEEYIRQERAAWNG
jgi:hypothetical protein